MSQLCQTIQIGRVGKIKEVGPNLLISVASDVGYKGDNGEWQDRTNWIEHTLFARQEGKIKWVRENLQVGDLVTVRSTPSQTSWEKDGEKHYGYTFAIDYLRREAKAEKADEQKAAKPAKKEKTRR
jgi:single-strand DNA-binding protein